MTRTGFDEFRNIKTKDLPINMIKVNKNAKIYPMNKKIAKERLKAKECISCKVTLDNIITDEKHYFLCKECSTDPAYVEWMYRLVKKHLHKKENYWEKLFLALGIIKRG